MERDLVGCHCANVVRTGHCGSCLKPEHAVFGREKKKNASREMGKKRRLDGSAKEHSSTSWMRYKDRTGGDVEGLGRQSILVSVVGCPRDRSRGNVGV